MSLSQRLAHRNFVEAATRIGGVQAQVMSAAEMALGARGDGLAPRDVQSALWRERTLVKTWLMRGTLHLGPAVELPLYVAARAAHEASSAHKAPRWAKYFAHFGIETTPVRADYGRVDVRPMPLSFNFLLTDVAIHEYVGIWRYYVYNALGWNS